MPAFVYSKSLLQSYNFSTKESIFPFLFWHFLGKKQFTITKLGVYRN